MRWDQAIGEGARSRSVVRDDVVTCAVVRGDGVVTRAVVRGDGVVARTVTGARARGALLAGACTLLMACGSDSGSSGSNSRGSGAGGQFAGTGGAFTPPGSGGASAGGGFGGSGAAATGGMAGASGGAGGGGGAAATGGVAGSGGAGGAAGSGGAMIDAGVLDGGDVDGGAGGSLGDASTDGSASPDTGAGGADGSAGTGGSGGTMDSGGSGGTGGTGGSGDSGGTGGTGGSGDSGGAGGTDGASGAGGATQDSGTDDAGSSGGDAGTGSFPPVDDFAEPGPFDTVSNAEGPACTIFRPDTLGEDGLKHPIIIWGNGTGASPAVYSAVLTHWASHGFIVAAANTSNAGTGSEMIGCLDYVLEQDEEPTSPYFGAVDGDHVGASGHSQGGGGSIMAGQDSRATVTAPLQPYTQQGFGGYDQASIGNQQGPMFLMSGGADNIATPVPNQQRVFDGANVPVFWGTLVGADHIFSAIGNISGYRGPATAWFRLHLMADETARSLFYGQSCGLCTSTAWEEQRKDIQ